MGVVYEAVDTSPTSCRHNHTVALKILSAEIDAPDHLVREAQLMAALDHPNIVRVYEAGEHEGIAYFAMKRVEGEPLATPAPPLDRAGRAAHARRAAAIAAQIAQAMEFAHKHTILHRDLKPANVLIEAKTGNVYVTDFGLATREGLAAGAMLSPGGTPRYMAPEAWRGDPRTMTTAVDVWGTGAILHELLTGRPPFDAVLLDDLEQQVTTKAPPALVEVDADLAAVCLRCLEKDPARRYATASELALDLARFLAGDPVSARPLGRGARWLRRAARHPVITALCALLVVAALHAVVTAVALGRAQRTALRSADFAARRLADLTAMQFERYAAVVKTAGLDPAAARAMVDPTSTKATDLCVRLLAERSAATAGFSTWFVLDVDGVMIGRAPEGLHDIMGRSFRFRDYFSGAEEHEKQGLRAPYVSRIYHSEGDDDYEIGISFPVHDAAERWVGLLVATVPTGSTLGAIELDDADNEGLTAALVAPRGLERGERVINPEPIFMVHRALQRGEARPARETDVLGEDTGSGAFVRLVPVRGTPFSVLVRVALEGQLAR
jgi:serine/threonine-protein kinase